MADDDEKSGAGDDPWAGLGGDESPDLAGGFSFSFDEESTAEPTAESAAAADPMGAEADDIDPFAEAIAAGAVEEPAARPAEGTEPADDDAAIGDWLSGADDSESAGSMVASGVGEDEPVEAGTDVDFAASGSGVEIGTGTSGIVSASGIDAFGAGDDGVDPFAAFGSDAETEVGGEPVAFASETTDGGETETGDEDPFAAMGTAGAAVAAGAAAGAKRAKPGRRPAPRRKQPSVIGQLVGVILGGAMAIPITFAILIWGFGKDPFNLTPMVPDSLAFLLPAKFRAGGPTAPDAIDVAGLPSIDDAIGGSGGTADAVPKIDDAAEPVTEPSGDEQTPAGPPVTDVVAVDPPAAADEGTVDDPLMNLLDESPAPSSPPAPPEPEPLDLTDLDTAISAAGAALEAVAAVDDPADPVRRKLMARWYKSLATYAEELAALESQAAETGRPFGPAAERADTIRGGLADHPHLLQSLGGLARDWIAYSKRPSDGLVMPGTFVAARRVGPYWRSQVELPAVDKKPALEMTVLTRTEPAVAPGDPVVVTGLAVDGDTVWAVEVRTAAADRPGL